jgi:hypothetical protein
MGCYAINTQSFDNNIMSTPYQNCSEAQAIPQASFLGLPIELRFEIYAYLTPTLYHVDDQCGGLLPSEIKDARYRRPCVAPDPRYPFLCSKPAFCGWYPTAEICRYDKDSPRLSEKQPNDIDLWAAKALRQTCRLVYEETKGILDGQKGSTLTLRHTDVYTMLVAMRPNELAMIVNLTVQYLISNNNWHGSLNGMNKAVTSLRKIHTSLPNLRLVAIQATERLCTFSRQDWRRRFQPQDTWNDLWYKINTNTLQGRDGRVIEPLWYIAALVDAFKHR